MTAWRFQIPVALVLGTIVASACSAGGPAGSGAENPGSGGSGANAGTSIHLGGSAATGNLVASGGGDPSDSGCQHVAVNFVPKIPNVFVLVDRSDSMFTPDNTTQVVSWNPLKAGVLDVIDQLQADVKFGFGAFTGQQGGKCPIFDTIAPALNNAAAIKAIYEPLGRVTGAAGETPVIQVLPLIEGLLAQGGDDGDKYVLFVTDGEPDFCDNGDAKCPVDAVVSGIQKLAEKGIHTYSDDLF